MLIKYLLRTISLMLAVAFMLTENSFLRQPRTEQAMCSLTM